MINFGESDKMIKISRKVDKSKRLPPLSLSLSLSLSFSQSLSIYLSISHFLSYSFFHAHLQSLFLSSLYLYVSFIVTSKFFIADPTRH